MVRRFGVVELVKGSAILALNVLIVYVAWP
jgi:hypothetical protein